MARNNGAWAKISSRRYGLGYELFLVSPKRQQDVSVFAGALCYHRGARAPFLSLMGCSCCTSAAMDRQEQDITSSKAVSTNRKEFTLPSTLESVATLERAAEEMAAGMGLDEDDASNIAMVTREAAINAVKHGNQFAADKSVRAVLECTEDRLSICIADQGQGLDADALPDPRDPANLLRSSGRGVFLMRALVDEVHFRKLEPGTEVTLIKHRHSEASS